MYKFKKKKIKEISTRQNSMIKKDDPLHWLNPKYMQMVYSKRIIFHSSKHTFDTWIDATVSKVV